MKFESMTWPDVRRLDRDRTLCVAPIASCEQHSLHLPTITDSVLVGAVASGVEKELADSVLLLPVQWLGASDHHQPFGATITASVLHHIDIVSDIVRSLLADDFRRVLVLNGHGGNTDTMRVALRQLQPEFPSRVLAGASYWDLCEAEWAALATGERKGMGHACEFETAMMMHLRPESVRVDRRKDDHQPLDSSLRGLTLARDFSQMTHPGAIGFPSLATAEKGKAFLDAAVRRTMEVCQGLLSIDLPTGRVRRSLDL